jgi:hypothetical protein
MKRAVNDNEFAATGADEGTRAQHWRQVLMELSIKDLSELTGYSVTAIRCFEANANTSGELFGDAAWKRYRMACCGVILCQARSREFPDGEKAWPLTRLI